MSVLRKSSVRDYWSLRPIIHTPYAASVGISRDRFLALLTMLHLNNNDGKAVVNAHILHNKTSNKQMSLEIFYEKLAEGLLASACTEIQVQGQSSSPALRLVGRDHFLFSFPVTHAKLEGIYRRSCRVCADRSKR
jgi:hypothetical protein